MDSSEVRTILGKHFIGIEELHGFHKSMNLADPLSCKSLPEIPYSMELLASKKDTHVLFPGIPMHADGSPVTLNSLRNFFGTDPAKQEPCFYNQDWYVNEPFANASFQAGWYFLPTRINDDTRGKSVEAIRHEDGTAFAFPPAVLTAYFFFLHYFHTKGGIVLKHDYAWNSDLDSNGDRIYVGKYTDPLGINKNGFEVHRHLSVKSNYGAIELL